MMKPRASLAPCVLVMTATWLGVSSLVAGNAPRPAEGDSTAPLQGPVPVGSTCSNTGCHGGQSGPTSRQSFSIWASADPHADAYRVLFDAVSRRIVARLRPQVASDKDYQEYVDEHCAACHATVAASEPHTRFATAGAGFIVAAPEVGCASCHGDPAGWLDQHFKPAAPGKSMAQVSDVTPHQWTHSNREYGLRAIGDELTRARTCVGCHVGDAGSENVPPREVNHDLIAAGHPRLAFEYTSHLANLPRHWDEGPAPHSAEEDRAAQWAIGQLVAAEAALDLLIARTQSGVWPEYSEYNCAACHHSLTGAGQAFGSLEPRTPTRYTWGTWYFAFPHSAVKNNGQVRTSIDRLTSAMNPLAPDKETTRKLAKELQQQLRGKLANLEPKKLAAGALAYFQARPAGSPDDWDQAVQHYLWLAQRAEAPGGQNVRLDRLYRALRPRPNHNGPLWPERWRAELDAALQSDNLPESHSP